MYQLRNIPIISFFMPKPSNPEVVKKRETGIAFADASEATLRQKDGKNYISYNSNLVNRFHGEHRELLKQFKAVTKHLLNDDYKRAKLSLSDFSASLRDHVLVENVSFYCGLEGMLSGIDQEGLELSKEMKLEMRGIQSEIKRFINPYLTVGFKPESSQEFLSVWIGDTGKSAESEESRKNSIQSLLLDRIKREEKTLYPLYEELGDMMKPTENEG